MEDPVAVTIAAIQTKFVEKRTEAHAHTSSTLIRIHSDGARNVGDFSFPTAKCIWVNFFKQHTHASVQLCEEAFDLFDDEGADAATETKAARVKEFLASTSAWPYPMERMEMSNERCALFLQRKAVIAQMFQRVLVVETGATSYGHLRKDSNRLLHLLPADMYDQNDEISLYRADLIRDTLRRVLEYSQWTMVDDADVDGTNGTVVHINVESVTKKGYKPNPNDETNTIDDNTVTIRCGIVRDPATGKLAKLETQEYLSLRSNDMLLMALHKYGIRAKDDRRFNELMSRLGTAAVTVDLLEVKHSSPVQIIRNGQGSTRGASFILYNSARMETLLRTFDERVQSSAYAKLPDLDAIDVTLLKEEEEWQLIFGYVFTFPNLIERCVEQLLSGSCATHLIIRYLSGLVAVFSVYYRRIRILTDTREHLMPYVHARVYLIKTIREILNKTLALLNIEPVMFM